MGLDRSVSANLGELVSTDRLHRKSSRLRLLARDRASAAVARNAATNKIITIYPKEIPPYKRLKTAK